MGKVLGIGGYTIPNFKVSVTLGMVIAQGQVIRNESPASIVLGTKDGVRRYLEECQPLVKAKVTDLNSGKDISNEFLGGLNFVPSRYQGGVSYVKRSA